MKIVPRGFTVVEILQVVIGLTFLALPITLVILLIVFLFNRL